MNRVALTSTAALCPDDVLIEAMHDALTSVVDAFIAWHAEELNRLTPAPSPSAPLQDFRWWFTTAQAGEYAALDPATVARACRSGALRAGQPSGLSKSHWRIHREDLDAWLRGEKPPA